MHMHLAARYGDNPAIVGALLDAGADAAARDNKGNSPWDYAQDNETLARSLRSTRTCQQGGG